MQLKKISLITIVFLSGLCAFVKMPKNIVNAEDNTETDTSFSIHQFKVRALDGSLIDFGAFKGKKILIVNTASECGYTPQYKELQQLSQAYADKLVVVGFPANNFGGQEPGSNQVIQAFCKKNYDVTFPMSEKISVKGNNIDPIYQYLTQKKRNGRLDAEVNWNFNKFLLDENGMLIKKFESNVLPMDEKITSLL